MTTAEVLREALMHGLVLSLMLGAVVVVSLRINAETWLNDYPPDIREAFGAMSEKARKQRIGFALLFAAVLIGTLVVRLVWLFDAIDSPGFFEIFLYVAVLATVFNAFDLLVLDWLWFVKLQPSFIVLPGTEGLPGYQDYGFHFRAFLTGLAGTVVLAGAIGGIAVGARALA